MLSYLTEIQSIAHRRAEFLLRMRSVLVCADLPIVGGGGIDYQSYYDKRSVAAATFRLLAASRPFGVQPFCLLDL